MAIALAPAAGAATTPPSAATTAVGELVLDGEVVGRRVEARPGEPCLVCGHPVEAGDPVYRVRGQRVPVHAAACEPRLRSGLRAWLARIQPSVALFSADQGRAAASRAWFFAGLYVLAGLVFGGAAAHLAVRKALPPVRWFFVGLLLNAVGLLLLASRPRADAAAFPAGIPRGLRKVPATHDAATCPHCGAAVHPAARRCAGCGGGLTPSVESEAERWRSGAGRPG